MSGAETILRAERAALRSNNPLRPVLQAIEDAEAEIERLIFDTDDPLTLTPCCTEDAVNEAHEVFARLRDIVLLNVGEAAL